MQRRARRFPGRPDHVGAARGFVAGALAAWPATQEAAQLLVSEVVTNAIVHSASGDQGGSLEVRYVLDDHEVYVEVLDAGGEPADTRPDELWVIQINPTRREGEPRTMVEIADRRNEVSGNLSLHQELGFIEKIDQLLEEGRLATDGRYKQIVVRLLELTRPSRSRSLGTASKLNRDPAFIRELLAHGRARAEEFLAAVAFERAWRDGDATAVLGCFADDAELSSAPPFPDQPGLRGRQRIGRFVRQHLTTGLHLDPTRKQVAGDRVIWTVWANRDDPAERIQGRAEAELRDGKVVALRLGG